MRTESMRRTILSTGARASAIIGVSPNERSFAAGPAPSIWLPRARWEASHVRTPGRSLRDARATARGLTRPRNLLELYGVFWREQFDGPAKPFSNATEGDGAVSDAGSQSIVEVRFTPQASEQRAQPHRPHPPIAQAERIEAGDRTSVCRAAAGLGGLRPRLASLLRRLVHTRGEGSQPVQRLQSRL
mgnify:CR=1 FL=1